jgi:hypothetical protein
MYRNMGWADRFALHFFIYKLLAFFYEKLVPHSVLSDCNASAVLRRDGALDPGSALFISPEVRSNQLADGFPERTFINLPQTHQ